jgi:small multidrug resistance family-3 protein
MALAWGVLIEGFRPDRWDILGASVALLGAPIMVAAPHA